MVFTEIGGYLPFKKIDAFITSLSVKDSDYEYKAQNKEEFSIKIEQPEIGKRFAGLVFPYIKNKPSSLWMAFRLMRVGSRPIDAIVDITNYVLLEFGQPLHAFNHNLLKGKKIIVRFAENEEVITTLDGVERKLTPDDILICDEEKPIALGGIMGGSEGSEDPDDLVGALVKWGCQP